ncbi:MAG: molybdenum cofactor guanylyltransferase [Nitrospirota bacterium]
MDQPIADVTGVLLAGGKSRRMGEDKRFLTLAGQTLLERALSVLEGLFTEVLVVVGQPEPRLAGLRHPVVADLIPGCATLGGLYTGLSEASHQRIFAAACDMPFLNPAVIRLMAQLDRTSDVVMARLANGLQPMHAFYSKACLPYLREMLNVGNLTVQDLCRQPALSVRLLSEEELRQADPQLLSFMNVNAPADLEFARKLLAGRQLGPAREG